MARKRQAPQHNGHDRSYKLLFSHPEMVADLLRGYIDQPWVEQLDFSTLSRVPDSYVSSDLREREDDIIWRVRWADDERWLYIYLLLEFQSSIDRYMALRILTYLGLLYEDLVKGGELTSTGKLPPVLPIVLYNGEHSWQATTSIDDLIDRVPGGLDQYRPSLQYLLLDENAYADAPIPQVRNLVAALFGLENSRTPEDMQQLLSRLIDWLTLPEQMSLRRNFIVWIKRVLLPSRMDGINFEQLNELQEISTMLSEQSKSWTRNWKEQGLQQGLERGLEQGLEQGRKEGEQSVLQRLLTRRFGPLDAVTQQRLQEASSADLERWADNILDARTLDEVFT
ncbi:Rpn family recombination-promoting nuclease/putative transposase [Pseudomonas sp. MYb185]|uniref:Rpn family recombination-promoting nuclease/putative transposase n=1 Tax=Pseudomonas sp. MYb185 TaxID=1848729 RepID=UPI000CFCEE9F|nr:Rpn family recombination-promoting nuclease/putative transposase [Pseudomonas sp. MYb185]PRB83814.1 transposase [Pseudomonas sp. MYb185]